MKKRLVILGIFAAVLSAGLVYIFFRIDFIPFPFSKEKVLIDRFVRILFSIASVFLAFIIVVFADAVLFFRRRPGDTADGPAVRGYSRLEFAWTLIPLAVVIGLSVYGAIVLGEMTATGPPQSELEVDVTAFRFGWQFEYPQYSIKSFDLELPVNQRVLFRIQSKDVIHSFWVPEFGPKQDAVPGLTTELRVTPTKVGQYLVRCSQLCGSGHTFMTAPVHVTSPADFQTWVKQQQAQQQ